MSTLFPSSKKTAFYGFTLVELMISLVILSLLFRVGFINFRDFSRRQVVMSAARQVEGHIKIAQQLALSGEKPETDCDFLNGYWFTTTGTNSYSIVAACSNDDVPVGRNYELEDPLIFLSTPSRILFKVIGEGNDITKGSSEEIDISMAGVAITATVTVTSSGNVSTDLPVD